MRNATRMAVLAGCGLLLGAVSVWAQDWPQWRGPNRDNKAAGFTPPQSWPKTLTKKWRVTVGAGDSSPVLVGDKVYVFGRQGGDEVTLCLDAANGKELWRDKYATQPADFPAGGIHAGPRATPAVAEGKVCTQGVRGVVSCLDANTGKVVWRKDTWPKAAKPLPRFFTSSSPLIVDGMCIVFARALTAYDLDSGKEKWKLPGAEPEYGSPVLMTVAGTKQIVTPASGALLGVSLADGKQLWRVGFSPKYNNGTPIIDGQTVIFSGQGAGTMALQIEKQGDKFNTKPLWKKTQSAGNYNTPVLKDGLLYGIAARGKGSGNFFCMDAKTGDMLWTDKASCGDCGAIIDAGSVLLALTNDKNLVAFQPSNKGYKELARFQVADTPPWAVPIISGNRVFVKDQSSVTLWTVD